MFFFLEISDKKTFPQQHFLNTISPKNGTIIPSTFPPPQKMFGQGSADVDSGNLGFQWSTGGVWLVGDTNHSKNLLEIAIN